MSWDIVCRNCGFVISSSDLKKAAKAYAETVSSCQQCNSRKFDIVERTKDVQVVEDDEPNTHDDQQSLDEL